MFQWVTSRVFLQSAVCRMMAGAAPRRTQQLLDGSLRPRLNRSSIICGKGMKAFLIVYVMLTFCLAITSRHHASFSWNINGSIINGMNINDISKNLRLTND